MPSPLAPDPSSIGVIDGFKRNFTKALYLRSQPSGECERGLGYGPGRLSQGWWLLFALERPTSDNFEFGGYTHFSGARIGHPSLGNTRPTVEEELQKDLVARRRGWQRRRRTSPGCRSRAMSGWPRSCRSAPARTIRSARASISATSRVPSSARSLPSSRRAKPTSGCIRETLEQPLPVC